MDNKTKVQLTKMRSLMERVDKKQTFNQAMINEEAMINEAVNPNATQVTRNEFLDILNAHQDSQDTKIFSLIYAKPEKIYGTKQNWRTDDVNKELANYGEEGNEHWYKQLKDFNDPALEGRKAKSPFAGVLAIQKYVLNMAGYTKYGDRYNKYKDALSNLRMRYGGGLNSDGMLGDNTNQRTKSDTGAQFNQTGNLSIDIDLTSKVRDVESKCYLVGNDGSILGEMPRNIVKTMQALPKDVDPLSSVEKEMKNVISDPEVLNAYAKARAEIAKQFNGKNFLLDRILCMVATVDGKSYYYINDATKTPIKDKSEVFVNPQEMAELAKDEIGASLDVMNGFAN